MGNRMGLSSVFFKEPSAEKWAEAVKAGFTDTELCLVNNAPLDKTLETGENTYKLLAESGIAITSVHLPFGDPWDISALEEPRCSNAFENLKKTVEWAAGKGISIAVIHASYEPVLPEQRGERMEKAAGYIKELSIYARERKMRLAVENLPRTCLGNCAGDMLALTGNGADADICFDVNHLLLETHKEFTDKTGPYIITTHLSDYDKADERHWLPGDGCIDWHELAELLEAHNYSGRLLFELSETNAPSLGRRYSPAELLERFRRISEG